MRFLKKDDKFTENTASNGAEMCYNKDSIGAVGAVGDDGQVDHEDRSSQQIGVF